ncbi:disease resistance protein RUN1-like isoform X6 [Malus sylvestris]|uniref:disease resistance protein RUN1-like isoform X6 n=1 Tax=Malus sylvestris TaxID=3752 RepID=UPI0021AC7E67|nr:disease resistance protein RUN1-like isoform X6 [Malus sylvestris]
MDFLWIWWHLSHGIILRQHKHNPCHFSVSDLNHCSAITVDTAMTAHEASSSSSSKSKLWSYDVFLSFRGEDTRNGFTSHLHEALKNRGYQVFIDEDGLERGEEIKEKLFRAIEESRISLIVFSKMYADSSWCLDELVKIMECRDKLGRHVLPIFYHVDPSHIRKQNGDLAEAFQKHEKDIHEEKDDKEREAKQERVKQWREALTKAANLSGHHLQIANNRKRRREGHTEDTNLSDHQTTGNGREAEFIKKIVDESIWKWLPITNELHVTKHLVGIKSRIQGIINDLSSGGSNDVLMVGIWGMGGLGKTTAAKRIYNEIHREFEFKSFLADNSDSTSKHRLVYLQNKLIFDILKKKSKIRFVDEGTNLIKQQFQHRRVLVIMDNIDEEVQLCAIAGSRDWFGPGSRIIITTRDERLLLNVDKVYPLQEMNEDEAMELFSWHAFGNRWPNEEYLGLSKNVVSYCGGLPLALEVLGSFFFKRTIAEWKSQLEKLKRTPYEKIINPLRISFEGLDDKEKAIFLDISCFFIGKDKDYIAKILDGCGFSATIGISVLRERCLISVEDNKLNMHDLLREMARIIISERSPDQPGKWSRLWNHQEVTDVLTNNSGTGKIEGLALRLPYYYGNTSFSTKAFAKMKKLRLLDLNWVELKGEYKHLPKELIWLSWAGCPLKSIPDDCFNQDKLVVLEMHFSNLVQVWEGSKSLHNLKTLDLSYSDSLQKSPDFSQVPYLEELILEYCISLSEIHPSIGHLKRLSLVNLKSCSNLRSLPRDFYKLKSVETLLLNDCSIFIELHEDIGKMISLRTLEAEDTAIREVPPSIVGLKNLAHLSLTTLDRMSYVELNGEYKHLPKELIRLRWFGCPLKSIPDDFFNQDKLVVLEMWRSKLVQVWEGNKSLHNLKTLDLSYSDSLQKSPDFSQVPYLEELILEYCISLSEIHPSIGHLKRLSLVNLSGCYELISLPRDFYKSKSVETLLLNWCTSFREVHEDIGEMISLRTLEADRTAIREVPPSIVGLKNLTRLSLNGNKFRSLPNLSGLSKLETLRLNGSKCLCTILDLPTNLKVLLADDCPALETMPDFSEMSNMRELDVSDSAKLTEVPGLDKSLNSMTWIDMHGCPNLTADFRKNILQGWTSCGIGGIALHGNYVPNWFDFVNEGTQVSFDFLPTDDHNFEGLTLFCLFRCGKKDLPNLQITVISNTKRTKLQAFKFRGITSMNYEDDYLWQGQLSNNELNLQGGDKVDIVFENQLSKRDNSVKIMRTGVNLVWDKLMKENMHDT